MTANQTRTRSSRSRGSCIPPASLTRRGGTRSLTHGPVLLLSVLGALVILVLIWDVFITVFHAQGLGGPINRRQNRWVWALVGRLSVRRDGSRREGLLALAGPTVVLATLSSWVLLLIGAFALIYFPWVETFLVSPGTLRAGWAEALYYSGYTASTLGLGDIVADTEALRLITALEAIGGFALLSSAITYFLAVYRELIAMQSLASGISALFDAGEDHLLEHARREGPEALARWCEHFANRLSGVLLAHAQYPVLHYFHPKDRSRALPVQVGPLLRLRRMLRESPDPELSAFARHPSFLAMENSLAAYLREVDRLFVPEASEARRAEGSDELERAHDRLIQSMHYTEAPGRGRS